MINLPQRWMMWNTEKHGRALWVCVLLGLAGCATTPGARPEENSVAGHDQLAREHEAQMTGVAEKCRQGVPPTDRACWTSLTNPSQDDIRRAEMHQKMAADHRAASQSLRDAESSACAGVSEQDRDQSPFDHRGDIDGVDPLSQPLSGKSGGRRMVGAAVRLRAVPGMTAEWLQRVVNCHLARNASLGYAMPEMSYCPLMLKGVTATVRSVGAGFAVEIRSDDMETAREIQRRAEALLVKS